MARPAPTAPPTLAAHLPAGAFWLFAYGSLMWRPGFPYLEARPALLRGYHRSLCVYSHVHRGTRDCPGLVLGLDHGGSCRGVAFRIAAEHAADAYAAVWEREMVTAVYVPRTLAVALLEGERAERRIQARCFTIDRGHEQYARGLTLEAAARLVAQGQGRSGHCRDYLASTVDHLDRLGITDGPLHRLRTLVEGLAAGG